ncbi:MAG TPA: hypothetical protein VKU00_33445 [Chthonomonadaceae bacterium]|nr:hypothetical protein [Chthonomonadaceae bacterium]
MADTQNAETVYVCVRTDLPLADQMVQVGHACLEGRFRLWGLSKA